MESHTLFNIDCPTCLYCHSSCDVSASSLGNPVISIDKYSCQKCKEEFEIHYMQDSFIGFSFTCEKLRVFHLYHNNMLGIDNRIAIDKKKDTYIWIPYFKFDFSKKEWLCNKLKTYVMFA